MDVLVERVATTKTMNAGQICLAPDYLNIHESRRDDFVDAYTKKIKSMYPTIVDNEQYTSIITPRHRERIEGYLDDAREKGADVRVYQPCG